MTDPIERAAQVLRSLDGTVTSDVERRSHAAFLAATEAPPRRRWPTVTLAVGGVGAAALAAALAFGVFAPLTYQVEGTHDGNWVRATEVPATIRFSEGTVFELAPGGSAEVTSADSRGAVVRVSSGVLAARVVHQRRARWSVQAGPYTVQVTGTRFTTRHFADKEVEVELFEGAVTITGPGLGDPLKLKPGQRFRALLEATGAHVEVSPLATPTVDDRGEAPSAAEGPAPEPEPDVEPPVQGGQRPHDSGAPNATPTKRAPSRTTKRAPSPSAPAFDPPQGPTAAPTPAVAKSWRERIAQGEFRQVVNEAREFGIDETLQQHGVDDVFALGEAARYLGDSALATRSLGVVRQRFSHTHQATHAALLLGRVAEQQGQWAQANHWYEVCESEGVPSLTPEAVGRRILVLQNLGQVDQAKAAASRYLSLDPSGPWAEVARRMRE